MAEIRNDSRLTQYTTDGRTVAPNAKAVVDPTLTHEARLIYLHIFTVTDNSVGTPLPVDHDVMVAGVIAGDDPSPVVVLDFSDTSRWQQNEDGYFEPIGGEGGSGETDPEVVRDTIAAALTAAGLVVITPNDGGNTIAISVPASHPHAQSDITGLAGTFAGKADASHSHTSASITDFNEAAQDAVAAAMASGTGATVTYDDAAGTITIAAAGVSDVEAIRDAIGTALIGVGVIGVTVDDAGNTITISSTATQNATDAALRDRSTHTGTQAIATVASLQAELDSKVAKAGDTMTGELVVPDLKVAGLAGSTQVGRFAGVTASGAPTSGAHLVGDYVYDILGNAFVCTVAGTPGTWAPVGSVELGYAEITNDFTTTSTSAVDVTGLSITVVGRGRPCKVTFSTRALSNVTANGGAVADIVEGSTVLAHMDYLSNPAGFRMGGSREARIPAFVGSKTFKATLLCAAGTAKINALGAGSQASLHAVEC